MALTQQLSNAGANAAADAIAAQLNNGYLRIYSGAQPANADAALGAAVLLAELRLAATAFGPAVGGVATANTITADGSADASGTAAFFRAVKADGATAVVDGSVGVTGCNLNLSAVAIVASGTVSVTAMTITQAKS